MVRPYSYKKQKWSICNIFPKYEIYFDNELFYETIKFNDLFIVKEVVRMLNESFEIGKLQGIIAEKQKTKNKI